MSPERTEWPAIVVVDTLGVALAVVVVTIVVDVVVDGALVMVVVVVLAAETQSLCVVHMPQLDWQSFCWGSN